MPIYQRPTENIGVTKTFSGTITDSGSTPIEGAVVALKRKGSGAILYADTDASGNYSFSIDADGDFQLEYSLSKDSSIRTTTDELSPANPYSWYSGGGYVNYSQQNCIVRLGSSSLFYPNGGGIVWTSMPSYRVIDTAGYTPTDPFSGGVVIGSYTETGIGEGAEVELGFANPGDYVLTLNGNPREYTAEEKNFGSIINKVTVTSIGRAYQTPILWISGTSINHRTKFGDPNEGEYARTVNGQEYWAKESSTTIAYSLTIFNIPSYVSAYPSDYSSRIREYYLNSINGYGEGYTYGAWTGNNVAGQYVQGTRFTAALPGEQDKSNFDSASSISAADAELISIIRDDQVYSVNNHQFQIYGQVIYLGVTGVDGNGVFNGYREGSAKEAESSGRITLKELDILKGYFGRYGLIEGILPIGGSTTTTISNFFNFGYQMIQGISAGVSGQYSADSPNNWMYEMDGGNKSTLFTAVAKEFRSFLRQKAGVDTPESQFGNVIYPILQKAGITFRYVGSGSQRQKWTFTSTGIVKVSDPE